MALSSATEAEAGGRHKRIQTGCNRGWRAAVGIVVDFQQ